MIICYSCFEVGSIFELLNDYIQLFEPNKKITMENIRILGIETGSLILGIETGSLIIGIDVGSLILGIETGSL